MWCSKDDEGDVIDKCAEDVGGSSFILLDAVH